MRTILSISLKNELKTHVSIWRFLSKIWNLLVALITTIKTNCMKLKTQAFDVQKEKEIVTRILIFELRILETNHHSTKAKQYESSIQKIS